jgi:hypothetical protein
VPINLAANFLPNSVVQLVSTGETFDKPFYHVMEDATLLFLDISGYTKLAEQVRAPSRANLRARPRRETQNDTARAKLAQRS